MNIAINLLTRFLGVRVTTLVPGSDWDAEILRVRVNRKRLRSVENELFLQEGDQGVNVGDGGHSTERYSDDSCWLPVHDFRAGDMGCSAAMSVCDEALQVPSVVAEVGCDAAWITELAGAEVDLSLVGEGLDDAGVGGEGSVCVDDIECDGCALGRAVAVATLVAGVDLADRNAIRMNQSGHSVVEHFA